MRRGIGHSFGFTITIWTVLCLGKKAVYHFNPLDARIVGELCHKHHATLLAATRWSYVKVPQPEFGKLQPGDFAELAIAFGG